MNHDRLHVGVCSAELFSTSIPCTWTQISLIWMLVSSQQVHREWGSTTSGKQDHVFSALTKHITHTVMTGIDQTVPHSRKLVCTCWSDQLAYLCVMVCNSDLHLGVLGICTSTFQSNTVFVNYKSGVGLKSRIIKLSSTFMFFYGFRRFRSFWDVLDAQNVVPTLSDCPKLSLQGFLATFDGCKFRVGIITAFENLKCIGVHVCACLLKEKAQTPTPRPRNQTVNHAQSLSGFSLTSTWLRIVDPSSKYLSIFELTVKPSVLTRYLHHKGCIAFTNTAHVFTWVGNQLIEKHLQSTCWISIAPLQHTGDILCSHTQQLHLKLNIFPENLSRPCWAVMCAMHAVDLCSPGFVANRSLSEACDHLTDHLPLYVFKTSLRRFCCLAENMNTLILKLLTLQQWLVQTLQVKDWRHFF